MILYDNISSYIQYYPTWNDFPRMGPLCLKAVCKSMVFERDTGSFGMSQNVLCSTAAKQ